MSNKIILSRQSQQFSLNDKRLETRPRYSVKGERVTNAVTYFAMEVIGALHHDLAALELKPNDLVTIDLGAIDDGKQTVYMVVGHLVVENLPVDKNAIIV